MDTDNKHLQKSLTILLSFLEEFLSDQSSRETSNRKHEVIVLMALWLAVLKPELNSKPLKTKE